MLKCFTGYTKESGRADTLDIESAKQLSYENMRRIYKAHLQGQGLGRNTVNTVAGDTFYLWNNVSHD